MDIGTTQVSTTSAYQSALRRLLGLVDFERMTGIGAPLLKQNLDKMEELMRRLDQPQRCAPIIHIAGTKGKGSVASMVSSILTAAGLRTGLFTSPHLYTFRERIRLDGQPVSEEIFARHLDRVWPVVEAMGASDRRGRSTTFETLTAMAFDLFREQQVGVQVIEVGMGGRLDSTNVADGDVAVITSLSLDHTAILGNDLAQVAGEKAGIIKPGAKVVLSPQAPEAAKVVLAKCREQGASVWQLGHDVTWRPGSFDLTGQELQVSTPNRTYGLRLPLLGAHQRENAAAAVAAVEALDVGVDTQTVVQGIRSVEWPGRFQVLSTSPYVVVDGAHNPYSASKLRQTVLEYLAPIETVLVFGCGTDKDLQGMVSELAALATRAVVCTSRHPKTVTADRLLQAFEEAGVLTLVAPDVATALADAQAEAGPGGLVLVTGSLFVVAEALESWYGIPPERYPELESPQTTEEEEVAAASSSPPSSTL